MPTDPSAAQIVAAADETRRRLFDLELRIEKQVDALRLRAFQEMRELTRNERAQRTKLRAAQAGIRDAHVELAHVTLARLDDSEDVRRLNARIGEVHRGLADDLQALKELEGMADKVADVADKLGLVTRKIAERLT